MRHEVNLQINPCQIQIMFTCSSMSEFLKIHVYLIANDLKFKLKSVFSIFRFFDTEFIGSFNQCLFLQVELMA